MLLLSLVCAALANKWNSPNENCYDDGKWYPGKYDHCYDDGKWYPGKYDRCYDDGKWYPGKYEKCNNREIQVHPTPINHCHDEVKKHCHPVHPHPTHHHPTHHHPSHPHSTHHHPAHPHPCHPQPTHHHPAHPHPTHHHSKPSCNPCVPTKECKNFDANAKIAYLEHAKKITKGCENTVYEKCRIDVKQGCARKKIC